MNRNLQQADIMYNMTFDFAIHGIDAGQAFFHELVTLLNKYGDSIRLVGYNVKKPTARVNTKALYSQLYVPTKLEDSKEDQADTTTESELKSSETSDEVLEDDKESDRTNQS